MKVRDAEEAEKAAEHIAKKRARSVFGVEPVSVYIGSIKLTEVADIPNFMIQGYVTIVTRPKGFLTSEETADHHFQMRVHAEEDKLLEFEWT